MPEPLRIVTDERLDVVAHRGWVELPRSDSLPAVGDAIELLSSDGRWGMRAIVVGIAHPSGSSVRVTLDRQRGNMYARPPVDDD